MVELGAAIALALALWAAPRALRWVRQTAAPAGRPAAPAAGRCQAYAGALAPVARRLGFKLVAQDDLHVEYRRRDGWHLRLSRERYGDGILFEIAPTAFDAPLDRRRSYEVYLLTQVFADLYGGPDVWPSFEGTLAFLVQNRKRIFAREAEYRARYLEFAKPSPEVCERVAACVADTPTSVTDIARRLGEPPALIDSAAFELGFCDGRAKLLYGRPLMVMTPRAFERARRAVEERLSVEPQSLEQLTTRSGLHPRLIKQAVDDLVLFSGTAEKRPDGTIVTRARQGVDREARDAPPKPRAGD